MRNMKSNKIQSTFSHFITLSFINKSTQKREKMCTKANAYFFFLFMSEEFKILPWKKKKKEKSFPFRLKFLKHTLCNISL